jgi:aryl-alcohol dehydrogenase
LLIDAHVVRAVGGPFLYEKVALAEPRPDEVLVRIVATGICHTDIAIATQYFPLPLPWVLGHEGAGVVEYIGAEVQHVAVGDHVVLSFDSCGACASCRDDQPAYCAQWFDLNLRGTRLDGSPMVTSPAGEHINGGFFRQSSFAQFALAHRRNVVKVRQDAPLELLAPLGCGIQTGAGAVLNVLRPAVGTSIAIFGAGAVGLAAIMAARINGCSEIVAFDKVPSRRALALELGATRALDPTEGCRQLIDKGGVDFSVEATGVPSVAEAAISVLTRSGTCGLLGTPPRDAKLSIDWPFLSLGRTVRGIVEGNADPNSFIPILVDHFMAGRLPIDRIIRFYDKADIQVAVEDCKRGVTIKPVVRYSSVASS